MSIINLDTLNWESTPAEWGLTFGETANLPGSDQRGGNDMILDFDLDGTRKARLAIDPTLVSMKTPQGMAFSDDTAHWPVLDRAFGRKQWQDFLSRKTSEMLSDLADWEPED